MIGDAIGCLERRHLTFDLRSVALPNVGLILNSHTLYLGIVEAKVQAAPQYPEAAFQVTKDFLGACIAESALGQVVLHMAVGWCRILSEGFEDRSCKRVCRIRRNGEFCLALHLGPGARVAPHTPIMHGTCKKDIF